MDIHSVLNKDKHELGKCTQCQSVEEKTEFNGANDEEDC